MPDNYPTGIATKTGGFSVLSMRGLIPFRLKHSVDERDPGNDYAMSQEYLVRTLRVPSFLRLQSDILRLRGHKITK